MELDTLLEILQTLMDNLPLLLAFIFISSCLQQWFPPYPGDTVMIVCGLLAGRTPGFALPLFAAYFLASLLSSWALYEVSVKFGMRILSWRWVKKLFPAKIQTKMIDYLIKYNVGALLASKILPGGLTVALLLSGAARLNRGNVYSSSSLVLFLDNALLFCLGKLLSDNLGLLKNILRQVNLYGLAAIGLIALVIGILWIRHKRRQTKQVPR